MPILFYSLFALAQQQAAGGWHEPFWSGPSATGTSFSIDSRPTEDLTGDGVRDVIERGFDWVRVLDGRDGSIWMSSASVDRMSVFAGDLSGDRMVDLVLLDWGSATSGRIQVIEGGSGRLLWERVGNPGSLTFGPILRLIDADGDGALDLLTLDSDDSRAMLRGRDGSVIWAARDPLQSAVHVVEDRTGDAVPELFLIRDPGEALLDGATGSELWATKRGVTQPTRVQVLDLDVTGDGVPDLVIGEPRDYRDDEGRIRVRDGSNGRRLWQRRGVDQAEQLGSELQLEDVTGDGFPELISHSRPVFASDASVLHVLDARTGQRLWRRSWKDHGRSEHSLVRIDINQDGVLDFVRAAYETREEPDRAYLHAEEAGSGTSLWPALPVIHDGWINEITLAKVDGDAVPDLILCIQGNAQQLLALSGATGQPIWRRFGVPGERFAFSAAVFERPSGKQAVCTVGWQGNGPVTARLDAFDLASGRPLWSTSWEQSEEAYSQLQVVDWNQDGFPELLAGPRYDDLDSWRAMRLHDLHDRGRVLWLVEDLRLVHTHSSPAWWMADGDRDGDGWLDPVIEGRWADSSAWTHQLSGSSGTWRSGATASVREVSAAAGAQFRLFVQAETHRANADFQLLFSENGLGLARFDRLDVPLAQGYWLQRTMNGDYPIGVFSPVTGQLDDRAYAQIDVTLAPSAVAHWIGRDLGVAVVTLENGQPRWSTGCVEIAVRP